MGSGMMNLETSDCLQLDSQNIRLIRLILNYCCKFCHIDLIDNQKSSLSSSNLFGKKSAQKRSDSQEKNSQRDEVSEKNKKRSLWTHIIRLFYFYITFKMIINLWFQHDYDYYQHIFSRHIHSAQSYQFDSFTVDLVRQIKVSRTNLKSIGAPHMHLNHVLECAYIYIIVTLYLSYLQPQFYFHYVRPLDFSLLRYFLDPHQEQKKINRVIEEEVNNFIISGTNYIKVATVFRNLGTNKAYHLHSGWVCSSCSTGFLGNQKDLIRELKQMMLNGILQPPNRLPQWISGCAKKVSFFFIFFTIFAIIFAFIVSFVFPLTFFSLETDLLDILFLIECWIYLLIGICSSALYLSIMGISCLDQIHIVKQLLKQIKDCILTNEYECGRLQDIKQRNILASTNKTSDDFSTIIINHLKHKSNQSKHGSIFGDLTIRRGSKFTKNQTKSQYLQMNSNLLRVFMHYKIFVVQLKPILRTSGFLVSSTIIPMILAPTLGRIYIFYLHHAAKMTLVLSSIVFVAFCDIYLASLCYFHSCCKELYRNLFSFLAHTVKIPSLTSEDQIYDRHLIWLLRKELNNSSNWNSRFATAAFGIDVKYSNLMRLHFWIGLLLLSIITYEADRERESLSLLDSLKLF